MHPHSGSRVSSKSLSKSSKSIWFSDLITKGNLSNLNRLCSFEFCIMTIFLSFKSSKRYTCGVILEHQDICVKLSTLIRSAMMRFYLSRIS
ncbi:hypothetical protein Hanom_Chr08g00719121 [Helianthus anomalus]